MTIEEQVIAMYIGEQVTEDIIAKRLDISEERVGTIISEYYDDDSDDEGDFALV